VTRLIRGVGWTLITLGVIVLLFVVYLLWFTGLETQREQRDLAETWSLTVPDDPVDHDSPVDGDTEVDHDTKAPGDDPVEVGDAYALLWFERDGEPIVTDDPLYIVEGVDLVTLRRGPGHYPESDRPGGEGNFAIAGHRTTYGAPFWSLDVLEEGDTIHVMDRQGREWVYAYVEQRIVQPTDVWVVGNDPLGSGAPTITLTTCHPRYSDAQRLIAWGELLGDPIASTAEDGDRDEIVES
jgi:sortase A